MCWTIWSTRKAVSNQTSRKYKWKHYYCKIKVLPITLYIKCYIDHLQKPLDTNVVGFSRPNIDKTRCCLYRLDSIHPNIHSTPHTNDCSSDSRMPVHSADRGLIMLCVCVKFYESYRIHMVYTGQWNAYMQVPFWRIQQLFCICACVLPYTTPHEVHSTDMDRVSSSTPHNVKHGR